MEEVKVISLEYESDYLRKYAEVVDFLSVSFPEWTTNSGVGSMSSELISACLEANKEVFENDELTKKEQLKLIYTKSVELYGHFRERYKLTFAQYCVDSFFDNHELFYDCKHEGELRKKYQKHVDSLRYKKIFNY